MQLASWIFWLLSFGKINYQHLPTFARSRPGYEPTYSQYPAGYAAPLPPTAARAAPPTMILQETAVVSRDRNESKSGLASHFLKICQSWQKFHNFFIFFWVCLEHSLTSGNDLEFLAIPTKFCEQLG